MNGKRSLALCLALTGFMAPDRVMAEPCRQVWQDNAVFLQAKDFDAAFFYDRRGGTIIKTVYADKNEYLTSLSADGHMAMEAFLSGLCLPFLANQPFQPPGGHNVMTIVAPDELITIAAAGQAGGSYYALTREEWVTLWNFLKKKK